MRFIFPATYAVLAVAAIIGGILETDSHLAVIWGIGGGAFLLIAAMMAILLAAQPETFEEEDPRNH